MACLGGVLRVQLHREGTLKIVSGAETEGGSHAGETGYEREHVTGLLSEITVNKKLSLRCGQLANDAGGH